MAINLKDFQSFFKKYLSSFFLRKKTCQLTLVCFFFEIFQILDFNLGPVTPRPKNGAIEKSIFFVFLVLLEQQTPTFVIYGKKF